MVVEGATGAVDDAELAQAGRLAETLQRHGADPRLVRSVVQELTGLSRNQIYDLVAGRVTDPGSPTG